MRKINYYKIKRMLHQQSGKEEPFEMTTETSTSRSSDESSRHTII